MKEYVADVNLINKLEQTANSHKNYYMAFTSSQAFIPIPYSDLALTPLIQAKLVHTILNDFGISLTEINWETFGDYLLGGGVREISHFGYNKISKKLFEKTGKGCLIQLAKMLMSDQAGRTAIESMKFVPFLGFIVGAGVGTVMNFVSTKLIGNKTISYCKHYLRDKGFIGFFPKNFEIFDNIFKSIEKLGKKENWWEYKMKIIKKD